MFLLRNRKNFAQDIVGYRYPFLLVQLERRFRRISRQEVICDVYAVELFAVRPEEEWMRLAGRIEVISHNGDARHVAARYGRSEVKSDRDHGSRSTGRRRMGRRPKSI